MLSSLRRSLLQSRRYTPVLVPYRQQTQRGMAEWSRPDTDYDSAQYSPVSIQTGVASSCNEFDQDTGEYVSKEVSAYEREQANCSPEERLTRQEADYNATTPDPTGWSRMHKLAEEEAEEPRGYEPRHMPPPFFEAYEKGLEEQPMQQQEEEVTTTTTASTTVKRKQTVVRGHQERKEAEDDRWKEEPDF